MSADFSSLFDFQHMDVTVMGLGRFGGGVGAVRFLVERGAAVTLTDLATENELADVLAEIDVSRLRAVHLGGHRENDFCDTDLIVVNPAVPRENRFLEIAREEGVPLSSEMNLFWQFQRGQIIGVTGSNGKSTTAALIHSMLQASGMTSRLGGNIGRSLLSEVDHIQPTDWTVLELSSFQLADLDRLPGSPDIAVVTNFSPNHLDWHDTLDAYRQAKQTILRWQPPHGIAVLPADDREIPEWPAYGLRYYFGEGAGRRQKKSVASTAVACHRNQIVVKKGTGLLPDETDEIRLNIPSILRGKHNHCNAAAAVCAALAADVSIDAVQQGLQNFEPLPHRLQFVAEWMGRKFYNDSLATTPESAAAAIAAFPNESVVILAGGYDKQISLTLLAKAISTGTKAAALMGETADELAELIANETATRQKKAVVRQKKSIKNKPSHAPKTHCCRTFEEAFQWACEQSESGDIVLLSPGCASLDWFQNFAERGKQFIELCNQQISND